MSKKSDKLYALLAVFDDGNRIILGYIGSISEATVTHDAKIQI